MKAKFSTSNQIVYMKKERPSLNEIKLNKLRYLKRPINIKFKFD